MRILCPRVVQWASQWASRCRWSSSCLPPPRRRQLRHGRDESSAYTAEALSKLLVRWTGANSTNAKPIVGRREEKRVLSAALAAEPVEGRASVIAAVGVGGSGKTFFLRAGVLRQWYPRNSIMVTYGEGATILDDGKMAAHIALARQLVQANRPRGRSEQIDDAKIESLDTVVRAFRIALGLDTSETLIVCVDGLVHLRAHVGGDTESGQRAGHRRCKEVRAAAMSYQDACARGAAPEIRFVWTSPTHHFETSLGETQADCERRSFHRILLSDLNATDSWSILGDELKELATRDHVLRWGFYLCAGHPRSLAGLRRYTALRDSCRSALELPAKVEQAILAACQLTDDTHLASVSQHLCAVVAAPSTMDEDAREGGREALMIDGVLHRAPQGTLRLHPALVHRWASARDTLLQRLVHDYFAPRRFTDARSFAQQMYLFEQILNCACAELRLTPTLQRYFAGAEFCGEAAAVQHCVVHPHVPQIREAEKQQGAGEGDVRIRLGVGVAVYAQAQAQAQGTEMGVDALIPLRLAQPKSKGLPSTHIFCGQSGVAVNAGNVGDFEAKVVAVVNDLKLQKAHGLYLTTNVAFEGKSFGVQKEKESKKQRKKRKEREKENKSEAVKEEAKERTGVWFTRPALEKWLGRIGMPLCTLPGIAPERVEKATPR